MLKPIKIRRDIEKIFLTGDTHFNHDRPWIVAARSFKTISEHDETLISRWNETVSTDSTVLHLGDFCLKADAVKFWGYVRRLNFQNLALLNGNHLSGARQAYEEALKIQFPNAFPPDDFGQPVGKGHYEVYPLHVNVDGDPNKMVTFLPEYVEFTVGKEFLCCSHYPLSSWHHMSSRAIHCHAHCHGNLVEKLPLRLDVGIDVFGRPVSLKEILRLTAGQEPAKVDHHG